MKDRQLELLSGAILVVDKAGLIKQINTQTSLLFGYEQTELLGMPIEALIPIRYRKQHINKRILYSSNMKIRTMGTKSNFYAMRKDGTEIPVNITLRPIPDNDECVLCTVRDLSEHRKVIDGLASKDEQLRSFVHHDSLTGLPDHTLLLRRLKEALRDADRHGRLVSVLHLNLDRFQKINERLGQQSGDKLLELIVPRLKSILRPGDTIARQEEHEFTIILANIISIIDIEHVAQQIMKQFETPFDPFDQECFVAPSVGICVYPLDGKSPEALLKNADAALYHAKALGRGNFQFFTATRSAQAEHKLALEMQLRQALRRQEFVLHYQPQIDLSSGCVVAVEALIRMRQSQKILYPKEFIAIAEDTNLMVTIGEWILHTACQEAKSWQLANLPSVKISVNLSARQLHDERLIETLTRILEETQLEPKWLALEISETAIMQDKQFSETILKKITAIGVSIVVDDFGYGYTCLNYLKKLPLSAIKIDKSVIDDILYKPNDAGITRGIISLSHSLAIQVIAEGVEIMPQLSFLKQHGCDQIQGYLYSKPLPAEHMRLLLKDNKPLPLPPSDQTPIEQQLLILEKEPNVQQALIITLKDQGYNIMVCSSTNEALNILDTHPIGVILCDLQTPSTDGLDFLKQIQDQHPQVMKVLLSGYTELNCVNGAMSRATIYRILTKPWDNNVLRQTLRDAFFQHSLLKATNSFQLLKGNAS